MTRFGGCGSSSQYAATRSATPRTKNGPHAITRSRTEISVSRTTLGTSSDWGVYFLADRRLGKPGFAGLELERVLQLVAFALLHEIADQRLRHAELRVGLEMRILGIVDLRGDGLVSRLVDEEVQVRRPHVVALLRREQRARRAVDGHGIARWLHAPETERTIALRGKDAAQVHLRLLRILVLIEPGRRGLPDVDLGVGDGLSLHIRDFSAK